MRLELTVAGSEKKEHKSNHKRCIHFQEDEKNEREPIVSSSDLHSVHRVLSEKTKQ